MSGTPPRPHDGLVKFAFSNPEYAAGALQAALPPELKGLIRWDTLERQDGGFVDHSLNPTESDLLFRAKLRDRLALIYLLFEHQSTVEKLMVLRVLGYVVQVLQQYARNHPGEPLPIVIPVVLHHSSTGWTAATDLAPLFGEVLTDHPELASWVPRFRFVLDDISHATDDELRARATAGFPRLVLWALRDARTGRAALDSLWRWADALQEVAAAPTGKDALVALFRYISEVAEVSAAELHEAVRSVSPQAEGAVMTLAEQLIQQGVAKGRVEGRAERCAELRRLVHTMLEERFGDLPPSYAARVEAADDAEVDALLKRLLSARSLDDLFRRK